MASRTDRRHGQFTLAVAEARPGTDKVPEAGPTFRHASAVMGFPTIPEVTTLYELFRTSVERYAERRCVGWRSEKGDYHWLTYKELLERARSLSAAMYDAGFRPDEKCGIYGANSPEWMLTLQALNRISGISVPLFDTLGESAVEYVIKHAETSMIFVSSEKLRDLSFVIPKVCDIVKNVVFWGPGDATGVAEIRKTGVKVFQFEQFVEDGAKTSCDAVPPQEEDPAIIAYTSGTTGVPKGVILSHANVVAAVAGIHVFLKIIGESVTCNDVFFSFLPIAGAFDRTLEEAMLSVGAAIGYWQGSVKTLMSDVRALQPTIFAAVPRVLDKIVNEAHNSLERKPKFIRSMFEACYKQKLSQMYIAGVFKKPASVGEKLVFRGLKKAFGGNLRFVISSGAALSSHVQEFIQVTMSVPVIQGYGLTETCAATFLSTGKPDYIGTAGPPLACTEFRIEAIPELGYSPNLLPPRGEICVRGPMVFQGYYRNPQLTQDAFDADGFLRTGDIGEFTSNGGVRIIDRKENLFKTAQGDIVTAEALELIYAKNPVVDAIWIYGESYHKEIVAVVVPNQRRLQHWAQHNLTGAHKESYESLLTFFQTKNYMLKELDTTAKANKLKAHESIKAVFLERDEWEVGGQFVTPSMKLKRAILRKYYEQEINAMYIDLHTSGKKKR